MPYAHPSSSILSTTGWEEQGISKIARHLEPLLCSGRHRAGEVRAGPRSSEPHWSGTVQYGSHQPWLAVSRLRNWISTVLILIDVKLKWKQCKVLFNETRLWCCQDYISASLLHHIRWYCRFVVRESCTRVVSATTHKHGAMGVSPCQWIDAARMIFIFAPRNIMACLFQYFMHAAQVTGIPP